MVDGTYVGTLNATDAAAGRPLTSGQPITAVWSGADVGSRCTLSITGTEETGYR
jgi:hypothetical protein